MKCVIMAGGFGTRLRPLTCNLPKPIVPMANRPMMDHIVELLSKHSIKEAVSMLYFQPEDIQKHFQDGKKFGIKMKYLLPPSDLGTAGCIKFAENELSETFIVMSGDVLTDFDLSKAIDFHKEKNALATMVLTRVTNPLQYGVVIIDEENKITRFLEKPSWGEVFSDTINTGIYILNPKVLHEIPQKQMFDFSKDLFPKLLAKKEALYGYVAEGFWKDVGDLREYRLAHRDILDRRVLVKIEGKQKQFTNNEHESSVWVDEGAEIQDGVEFIGNSILGKNCKIEAGCKIENSVIGENCVIGSYSHISGSVLWNHVKVGRESLMRETIVGEKVVIGEKALIQVGAVIADECKIGREAKIRSNVKMWPHKTLEDGAILATSLIWGEKWSRTLFGAYGISGLGNIEITPEFAAKVGAAYGAYVGKGSYIITSRDTHKASRMIKRALISGLLSGGVRVGDLRTSPIPVVRYEMGKEGEVGGVHIRQSPFDHRLIDIKFFDQNGGDISFQQEKAIEQLFLREDFKRASIEESGELVTPQRSEEYYRAGFLKTIKKEIIQNAQFKVVIDYAFSSAAMTFPAILGQLGIEVVALNSYHNPQKVTKTEKEFQYSLEQLSNIVTTLKADIGFLIDNGAEKVFIIDEKGNIVSDMEALVAISSLVLKCNKSGKIAIPINQTTVIEQLALKSKLKVERIPTIPRHIINASRREQMLFVGDGIGGFIFPEFQANFDAMYAIAKILEMLSLQNTRIGHLLKEIPYKIQIRHQKIPCPWDKKGQIMRLAFEYAKNKNTELVEGVKIHYKDSCILLLPDPDAAYFHLWAEAKEEKRTKELLKEYSEKALKWIGA
ncbi:MAG: mannose-1-phosphate guanyltransferase [Elusimicrobia bacterium]|nr:mannose-1-phosphate guanyltransferase [Elusimicrobiota bacterium]